jgi:hypothetical protein
MGWKRLALFAPLTAGVFALAAPPQSAVAQEADSLRAGWTIQLPTTLPAAASASRSSPGSSSGSPTAFGANFGDAFVGAGFQGRTRYAAGGNFDRDAVDGSAVVGFGLGNARDLVGLEVAITSVSKWDGGIGKRTAVSFKAHRLLPGNVGVGVGYENALTFGEGLDGGNSLYGVVSQIWGQDDGLPFQRVTTSIGVGNGRFRLEKDVRKDRKTANVFASLGVQVAEPVSLIADWTGQDLTLAASIVPFQQLPLIITPGVADVTGSAGDGARFLLGLGMGLNWTRLTR